jgi:type IV secretory pathway TrbD component
MSRLGEKIDRIAGRIYTRAVAVFTGLVAVAMLVGALVAWLGSRAIGGVVIWLAGALVFGWLSRLSWRSKAGLGDIDFTG